MLKGWSVEWFIMTVSNGLVSFKLGMELSREVVVMLCLRGC